MPRFWALDFGISALSNGGRVRCKGGCGRKDMWFSMGYWRSWSVPDVLSRSGRLDSCMACFRGDYGCSSWKSTGGITEVFPRGFPSVHGLRIMVNAFLPIRPDVTSVRHVIGKVRHRVGFAGEWRKLYSRCPPYVSCLLDRVKARHDNKFIIICTENWELL